MSNNIYLLGSGFTKSINDNAPLNNTLFDELLKHFPQSPALLHLKNNYHSTNIEILLTLLDLDIIQNNSLSTFRKEINGLLAQYFVNFRFDQSILENKWLEDFSKNILQENDIIITLNYDCLLEGVLDFFEVWSPNYGYAGEGINNPLASGIVKNPKNIIIYKIHGSENFILSSIMPNKKKKSIGHTIHSGLYPKSGLNKNFARGIINPQSYLIAPSFVKSPHAIIADLMNKLIIKSKDADNLIIIGCGLRHEDNYLWQFLTSFINVRREVPKKIIIVDPCASKIMNKIDDYFPFKLQDIVNTHPIDDLLQNSIMALKYII